MSQGPTSKVPHQHFKTRTKVPHFNFKTLPHQIKINQTNLEESILSHEERKIKMPTKDLHFQTPIKDLPPHSKIPIKDLHFQKPIKELHHHSKTQIKVLHFIPTKVHYFKSKEQIKDPHRNCKTPYQIPTLLLDPTPISLQIQPISIQYLHINKVTKVLCHKLLIQIQIHHMIFTPTP